MNRIPRLDGLRALAFLAVFLNHAVHLPMAWAGVDLFFVLSGFLITTILLRDRELPAGRYYGHFYARRAGRILPAYFLVLGIVALLGLPEIEWRRIWWHFLVFGQNFSVAYGLATGALTPYWSLAVEEQFYLIWPLVVFLLPRRILVGACITMVVGAPLLRAYFTPHAEAYTVIFCLTPFRMDLLAAGALIALLRERAPQNLARLQPFAWIATALGTAAFFVPAALSSAWRASAHSLVFNSAGYSCSVVLFAGVLLLALGSRVTLFDQILEWTPLVRLGRISYMCYLAHEPALQFAWLHLPKWPGVAAALALTLVISAASWRWIESPLLRSGQRS